MRWQLQEAKQRFSELVRSTLEEGPQVVTRHGEDVVVVVAAREYREAMADNAGFAEFLLDAPDFAALDLERSSAPAREVELEP
jgi:prevent-host-death family protein